jgi:hypothetical protein
MIHYYHNLWWLIIFLLFWLVWTFYKLNILSFWLTHTPGLSRLLSSLISIFFSITSSFYFFSLLLYSIFSLSPFLTSSNNNRENERLRGGLTGRDERLRVWKMRQRGDREKKIERLREIGRGEIRPSRWTDFRQNFPMDFLYWAKIPLFIIYVNNFWSRKELWVFLTHWEWYEVVVFYNVMISDLFNYMHRNSILHTVNNSDAGLITSWLLGWPIDRHTACVKNNNKYKLVVGIVNVLGKLWLLNWLSGWSMYLVVGMTNVLSILLWLLVRKS